MNRILFTIPNFITAGSGRVMLNILERLDRDKFSPAVCVSKKGGQLDREVERLGIPFIEAPFTISPKPYCSLFQRAGQAAKQFSPYKFDLWHSFHWASDYTEPIIARFSGARAWVYTKKAMGWGARAWYLRSYLATRIVTDNSEMNRQMFNLIGLKSRTRYIPHGIPTDLFTPNRPNRNDGVWRRKYDIDKSVPAIACVAHLVPVKGHLTLIEAFSKLDIKAHLFLAGKPMDEQYVSEIKQLIQRLNLFQRVHWLGGVEDIPGLLDETDVVVLPTLGKWRMEGCPVALLEAMACAKACVATDIPGSRDIIQDGVNGFLVPPENPKELSEKIGCLLEDAGLRERMGAAARQRILDHYTIEREVTDHERLYSEILF